METTRRGFFGLVAGALASVPVLGRLVPWHLRTGPLPHAAGSYGAIAPYTFVSTPERLFVFTNNGPVDVRLLSKQGHVTLAPGESIKLGKPWIDQVLRKEP